jgi:hypothetical protein
VDDTRVQLLAHTVNTPAEERAVVHIWTRKQFTYMNGKLPLPVPLINTVCTIQLEKYIFPAVNLSLALFEIEFTS